MVYTAFRLRHWIWPLVFGLVCWLAVGKGEVWAQTPIQAESTKAVEGTGSGPGLKVLSDYAASSSLARLPGARLFLVDLQAVPPVAGYKLMAQPYRWPRFNQMAAPLRNPLRGAVGGAYVGMMAVATDDFRHWGLRALEPSQLRHRGDEALMATVVGAGVGAVAYPLYKWIRPD